MSQLKTNAVQLLGKTDRLSQVTVRYRATLHAGDVSAHEDLVGLSGMEPEDAVLTLDWTLRQVPVTDRDGLIALLNRLPHPLLCEVTVNLRTERA